MYSLHKSEHMYRIAVHIHIHVHIHIFAYLYTGEVCAMLHSLLKTATSVIDVLLQPSSVGTDCSGGGVVLSGEGIVLSFATTP